MGIMRKVVYCIMVKWGVMRVGLLFIIFFDRFSVRWYVKERLFSGGNDCEF